jgi:hypothetical protein
MTSWRGCFGGGIHNSGLKLRDPRVAAALGLDISNLLSVGQKGRWSLWAAPQYTFFSPRTPRNLTFDGAELISWGKEAVRFVATNPGSVTARDEARADGIPRCAASDGVQGDRKIQAAQEQLKSHTAIRAQSISRIVRSSPTSSQVIMASGRDESRSVFLDRDTLSP